MGIYEPAEDSFLILRHIRAYSKSKRVLDMGSGSGILAFEAVKYAKSVTAADINPRAVKKLKSKLNAVQSDLFSNIEGRFDLILFNAPYLPDGEAGSIETDGGESGSETIERFLKEAKAHLAPRGIILLVFSSYTGDLDSLFKREGYSFKQVDKEKLFFEQLYLYELRCNT